MNVSTRVHENVMRMVMRMTLCVIHSFLYVYRNILNLFPERTYEYKYKYKYKDLGYWEYGGRGGHCAHSYVYKTNSFYNYIVFRMWHLGTFVWYKIVPPGE